MIASTWNDTLAAIMVAVGNGGKLAPGDDPEAYEILNNPLALNQRDEVCETLGLVIRKASFDEAFFVFPSHHSSMFALPQQQAFRQLGSIMSKEQQDIHGQTQARAMWAVLYVFIIDWVFDRSMKPTCRAVERATLENLANECRSRLQRAWEATKDDEEASAFGEVCASLYKRPMTDGQQPIASENKATSTLAGAINKVMRFLVANGIFDEEEFRKGFVVPTARGCAAYQYGIASSTGTLPKLLALVSPQDSGGRDEDDPTTSEEERAADIAGASEMEKKENANA